MTGIGRLCTLAGEWDAYGLGGTLGDVARQIERERACDADTIENVRLIVGHVIDGMERHVSGVEGADDSPVARWARELRGALKSDASEVGDTQTPSWHDPAEDADVTSEAAEVTRDPAEDVSMSAYDLLPEDERDAIAWVREHGGLDYVRTEWRSRVPRDRYERRRQRLLRHIAECETALGRRREIISKLTHRVSDLTRENAELRRRAMPEGCEWPRFEDGEPVGFVDDVSRLGEVWRICLYRDGSFSLNFRSYSKGERVRRPTVLAADGEPLEVGQTVWDTNGDELVIGALEDGGHTVACRYVDVGDGIPVHGMWSPSDLTHQRPVLDADGNRIEPAMDVWWVCEGDERGVHAEKLHVESIGEDGLVTCDPFNGGTWVELEPSELYVNRPVLDADGVPIKVGDTVYFTDGREQECNTVVHAKYDYKDEPYVQLGRLNEAGYPTYTNCSCIDPSQLTHTKPEIDTWERIEEDATKNPFDYCKDVGHRLDTCENAEAYKARDLVLRAKKLAGVDND